MNVVFCQVCSIHNCLHRMESQYFIFKLLHFKFFTHTLSGFSSHPIVICNINYFSSQIPYTVYFHWSHRQSQGQLCKISGNEVSQKFWSNDSRALHLAHLYLNMYLKCQKSAVVRKSNNYFHSIYVIVMHFKKKWNWYSVWCNYMQRIINLGRNKLGSECIMDICEIKISSA